MDLRLQSFRPGRQRRMAHLPLAQAGSAPLTTQGSARHPPQCWADVSVSTSQPLLWSSSQSSYVPRHAAIPHSPDGEQREVALGSAHGWQLAAAQPYSGFLAETQRSPQAFSPAGHPSDSEPLSTARTQPLANPRLSNSSRRRMCRRLTPGQCKSQSGSVKTHLDRSLEPRRRCVPDPNGPAPTRQHWNHRPRSHTGPRQASR
jgi:hypothetical protein